MRHFVLHADPDTLRERILGDPDVGPSAFRLRYVEPYAEAARSWLHTEAEVVDTSRRAPAEVAQRVVEAVLA